MKLKSAIHEHTIKSLKGIVDVYYSHGQPVARAWPKTPAQPQTPAQRQTRVNMQHANLWVSSQHYTWLDNWRNIPCPPRQSYRDQYIKQGIRAMSYTTPGLMPAIYKAEVRNASAGWPPTLDLHVANAKDLIYSNFIVYVRSQPPGDPAISYYDAGFKRWQCTAKKRKYVAITNHHVPSFPEQFDSPRHIWHVVLRAPVDAVSYFVSLPTPSGNFPADPPILTAPAIALPID